MQLELLLRQQLAGFRGTTLHQHFIVGIRQVDEVIPLDVVIWMNLEVVQPWDAGTEYEHLCHCVH